MRRQLIVNPYPYNVENPPLRLEKSGGFVYNKVIIYVYFPGGSHS